MDMNTDFFKTTPVEIKIKTLEHFTGALPTYESLCASGADIRARLMSSLTLRSLQRALIPTGLAFEIPRGMELQVRPRSGLTLKKGLSLINSPGTIDADYRGELKIIVVNLSDKDIVIMDQERIAQIVLCPVWQAKWTITKELSPTERGTGGFGSTGIK